MFLGEKSANGPCFPLPNSSGGHMDVVNHPQDNVGGGGTTQTQRPSLEWLHHEPAAWASRARTEVLPVPCELGQLPGPPLGMSPVTK